MEAETFSAFSGSQLIAGGSATEVAEQSLAWLRGPESGQLLVFGDLSGRLLEVDYRWSAQQLVDTLESSELGEGQSPASPRPRGRPRLGVVAREVTLLPRHWAWLQSQPGGASVALRRLVEEARRSHAGRDRVRQAQDAAYRFMSAVGGDLQGFEEATRALFARRCEPFEESIETWPPDLRHHLRRVAAPVFANDEKD
jgi:uncharacterized protein